jgi:hypothetical protein
MTSQQPERAILKRIHLALGSRHDCRLWRVSVGQGMTDRGQWISFGLPGMADLAGILRCGEIGVALFIEVKSEKGRLSPQQKRFRDMAVAFGACYVEARSVEDAVNGIEQFQALKASTEAAWRTERARRGSQAAGT